MKKTFAVLALVLSLGLTAALDAEAARRLGGGKSSGMQRDNVTAPAAPRNGAPNQPGQAPATAGTPAAAAAAPAAAAAAAPARRSWMGPVAGLAAGLGLAALASHLGFGEELANMLMIGLLVMAVLVVIGLIMRKRAGGSGPAMAGAGGYGGAPAGRGNSPFGGTSGLQNGAPAQRSSLGGSLIGSRIGSGLGSLGGAAAAAPVAAIPADFDVDTFVRHAKSNFTGLQQANDAGDLERLRSYLTPDMFDAVRADIAERGDAPQNTEVFGLEAGVLQVVQEDGQWVASVRFTGSIRHEHGAVPEDINEVWHLAKPIQGTGGWRVAGIQQV